MDECKYERLSTEDLECFDDINGDIAEDDSTSRYTWSLILLPLVVFVYGIFHHLFLPTASDHSAAFCITGGRAEVFAHPFVYMLMKQNLIDAYGAPTTKIFYLLKSDDPNYDPENLKEAFTLMKPENISWNPKQVNPFSGGSFWQTLNIQQCYDMILSFEKANNIRFDVIFKIRPDAAYVRKYPHWTYFQSFWNGTWTIWDHHFMTSREYSDIVMQPNRTKDLVTPTLYEWRGRKCCYENIMASLILQHDIPHFYLSDESLKGDDGTWYFVWYQIKNKTAWNCKYPSVLMRKNKYSLYPSHRNLTKLGVYINSEVLSLDYKSQHDIQNKVTKFSTDMCPKRDESHNF